MTGPTGPGPASARRAFGPILMSLSQKKSRGKMKGNKTRDGLEQFLQGYYSADSSPVVSTTNYTQHYVLKFAESRVQMHLMVARRCLKSVTVKNLTILIGGLGTVPVRLCPGMVALFFLSMRWSCRGGAPLLRCAVSRSAPSSAATPCRCRGLLAAPQQHHDTVPPQHGRAHLFAEGRPDTTTRRPRRRQRRRRAPHPGAPPLHAHFRQDRQVAPAGRRYSTL